MSEAVERDVDASVESLRETARRLREDRRRVEDVGRSTLRAVADAYDDVTTVLDRYEDRATDRDDLEGYIDFRDALSETLEALPADLRHADAFVEANDLLTARITSSLSSSDFRDAREALEPAREDADLYESWCDARDDYRRARHAVDSLETELRNRIDRLERVRDLGEADLDAPVEELAAPIESYDAAVTEAFAEYRREAAAADVVEWLATAEAFPLVDLPSPPGRLREYLRSAPVGEESIPTLVEYAGYSRSKLDHYVDDPQRFLGAVGSNELFLKELSADPLTVSWPPAPATRLRWRCRELVAVVGRFAPDDVVAQARTVRDLADRDDYERLRDAAVALESLTDDQRARLERGAVEEELKAARTEYERVADCLDEHPPLDG